MRSITESILYLEQSVTISKVGKILCKLIKFTIPVRKEDYIKAVSMYCLKIIAFLAKLVTLQLPETVFKGIASG